MQKIFSFRWIVLFIDVLFYRCAGNGNNYEQVIQEKLSSKKVQFEYKNQLVEDYLKINEVLIMKNGVANDHGTVFISVKCTYNGESLDLATYFSVSKPYDQPTSQPTISVGEPLIDKERLINSSEYQNY